MFPGAIRGYLAVYTTRMNLFKDGTLKWWQASILKVSVLCIGIAIGANWPQLFVGHTVFLVLLGVGLGLYLLPVWFKK